MHGALKRVGRHRLHLVALIVSLSIVASVCADNVSLRDRKTPSVTTSGGEVVSVANVSKSTDGKTAMIFFNGKERIFTIDASDKTGSAIIAMLQKAERMNQPVLVKFDAATGTIASVAPPAQGEMKSFKLRHKTFLKSEKPKAIDVEKLEPAETAPLNNAKNVKPVVVGKVCKAFTTEENVKKIFDFCAKQSCNLPGPYGIDQCIPFQFVWDGSAARAHKMASIIVDRFGTCCSKVFSFPNKENQQLSMMASKWGGCCYSSWYHVAPVVTVLKRVIVLGHVEMRTIYYVIDPGMFSKPVLLTEWLQAQANTSCDPKAKLPTYAIKSAKAYEPYGYPTTKYTYDDDYSDTNKTLKQYQTAKSCGS